MQLSIGKHALPVVTSTTSHTREDLRGSDVVDVPLNATPLIPAKSSPPLASVVEADLDAVLEKVKWSSELADEGGRAGMSTG